MRRVRFGLGLAAALLAMGPGDHGAGASPTTQPAVVSIEAFSAGDTTIPPEVAGKLKAKLVTIHLQNTPVLAAMDELAKVSGYPIKPAWNNMFRGKTMGVTYSADNQPFWLVFREICARGNITAYNNGGDSDHVIHIAPGNYMGPSGIAGRCRSRGRSCSCLRMWSGKIPCTWVAGQGRPHDPYPGQIYVEPGAGVTQMSYEPVVDEATDDHGNSMAPKSAPTGRSTCKACAALGLTAVLRCRIRRPTRRAHHAHEGARQRDDSGKQRDDGDFRSAQRQGNDANDCRAAGDVQVAETPGRSIRDGGCVLPRQ